MTSENKRLPYKRRAAHTVPKAEPLTLEFRQTLESYLRLYADEVDHSELSEASKAMYTDFARCFVRWVTGQFKPGVSAWGDGRGWGGRRRN